MKNITLLFVFNLTGLMLLSAQHSTPGDDRQQAIAALIDQYSQARETRDTMLLKTILTTDVDQLVSSGEWRNGISASVEGMLKSSANSPGTRKLNIDRIRMLGPNSAIVDCKYELQNKDGTIRKMWSTFIVVAENKAWKISAIRNMLPAGNS